MEGADAEVNWVQCNDCDTWRIVPPSIDLNKLPNRWHCEMNTWDPKRASCSAAEEVAPSASNHVRRPAPQDRRQRIRRWPTLE